ncbi:MAG: class I SAM-dependent methyltransferase [Burkholderiaceae bacterium]
MGSFWDQRYAEPGYKYGTEPNAFVVEQATRLEPGSCVLLPGDGEGRNSVWLAGQGHNVLAIDASGVGLDKARALAVERGVQIATMQADLDDWQPGPASADAVVLVYLHLPSALRPTVHRQLARALVPGGWLILEAFEPAQLGCSSGGPGDPDLLYPLDELEADFRNRLETVMAWSGEVTLDEGAGHRGPARVVRYVGRRAA